MHPLEETLGYAFSDPALLTTALTHRSYWNEHRREGISDNERLEYLGDAVLELCASEFLYEKDPAMPEGEMTVTRAAMVCEKALAKRAEALGIPDAVLLGQGEEKNGLRNRPSVTSDALEAVIGAVFLDGGFSEARRVVREAILLPFDSETSFTDSKTVLQELVQSDGGTVTYELIKEEGPDHNKTFTMEVRINGTPCSQGRGTSKKAAEQDAAEEAIQKYRKTENTCI